MDKAIRDKIEKAAYNLAETFREAAHVACRENDPDAVYFLATEERKAAMLPRRLETRFGVNR